MREQDKPRFAAALTILAIGLGVKDDDITETILDFYWSALKDLELDGVLTGMNRLAKTEKYFPKPEAIRRASGCVSADDLSTIAWQQVLSALKSYGQYCNEVDFQDKAINAAIRSIGGWVQLCRSQEEWLLRFAPHQFRQAYISARLNGFPEELGCPLHGMLDVGRSGYIKATPHQLAGRDVKALKGKT